MRLIDADKVAENLAAFVDEECGQCTGAWECLRKLCDVIDGVPTVDAEPVVRCKDCVFGSTDNMPVNFKFCDVFHKAVRDSDFCSQSLRRNNE